MDVVPSGPLLDDGEADLRLETTVASVNWDMVASLACLIRGTTSSRWGDQLSGGYNVVRFLHLDDAIRTVLVVRLPYRPVDGWTVHNTESFAPQMSSGVATMRYVAAHTSIPVPCIIHYSVAADGDGFGSPFMILTKVDGVPLSSLWDDMEDTKREIVLCQVVNILLELASQRFDKIGMLSQQEGDSATKQAWYVAPMISSLDGTSVSKAIASTTYTSAFDYWVAYANANLENIRNSNFGSDTKIFQYGHAWFMRSLIPALYDTSLDTTGFPLCPGDFHSQNIMIVNANTSPRVSAVIDWEFSGTHATSSFAQYPLFIVDHPLWEDDNPLRPRNIRDQTTFNVLMREAEMKKDPTGDFPLSRTFANCQGVYMFEQAIQHPGMFPAFYPRLFAHIYGEDGDFATDYYWSLMEHGILRKEVLQFGKETEVRNEVFKLLGDELVSRDMSKEEFSTLVQKYLHRFPEGGLVREWLAKVCV